MTTVSVKIPRNEAYKILRNQKTDDCQNDLEACIYKKMGHLSAGQLVDKLQSYANIDDQQVELHRRCRAAGLTFFFDAGSRVQFRKQISEA